MLGRPFTRWSLRKLADYLATDAARTVNVGRDRLRQILRHDDVSWQRTRTWKDSKDPDFDAKLDGSRKSPPSSPRVVSPSISSGRCRSVRTTAAVGHHGRIRTGCRRRITARTASGTSTTATASATTSSEVSTGDAKAPITPCPR